MSIQIDPTKDPQPIPPWLPVTVDNPAKDDPARINFDLLSQEVIAVFPDALGFNLTGTDPKTGLSSTLTLYLPRPLATDADKLAAVVAAHDPAGKSKGQQHDVQVRAARARLAAQLAAAKIDDPNLALLELLLVLGFDE